MLRNGIATGWRDAFEMPADVAMRLLEAMAPMESQQEKQPERQKVEIGPDGSRRVAYSDIADLAAALNGWSGMKVG